MEKEYTVLPYHIHRVSHSQWETVAGKAETFLLLQSFYSSEGDRQ